MLTVNKHSNKIKIKKVKHKSIKLFGSMAVVWQVVTDRQIDRQTAVILPPSLRMSYSREALEHKAYAYESSLQVPSVRKLLLHEKHNEKEPICLLTGRNVPNVGKGKHKLQIHKQYYSLFLSSVSVLHYTFKMILR